MTSAKRLQRSNERMIAGVCAGIAEWLGWQPVAIRALFALVAIPTFGGMVVLYLLLWWMMPTASGDSGFRLDDFRRQ